MIPHGLRRTGPEYIVASLANDHRHWTWLAPRLRTSVAETRLMRIYKMGSRLSDKLVGKNK